MRKTIQVTGMIFILLLLIFSTMPGVQAISSSPFGASGQETLPQTGESEAKISVLLSLQIGTKLRCQQTPPTADELSMLEAQGINTASMSVQRVFIHLTEEPKAQQLDEFEALGVIPYPDSWIPPVGEYPTGFMIADMPVDKLSELAAIGYVVQLDTAEQMLEPQNDLAAIKINADDVWSSGYDGDGVRIAVLDSGLDTSHPDIPAPVASKDYSSWPVLDDTITNTVSGHGTHVAGSVVGQGTQSSGATHQYKGMAPGADLIFLKIGNDTAGGASLDAMTNAIKDAVDTYEADIITMSYGGWGYYHDGTRQTSQAVDYAFGEGASVFISAGNEADDDEHYSGTVNAYSTTDFIQVNVTGSNGVNAGLGFNLVWYDGLANSNDLVLEYYESDQTALADTWASAQEESWKGTEHELSGYGSEAGWYYYLPVGNSTYYLKVTNNSDSDQFFHIYFAGIASNGAAVKFQDPDLFYTISSPADAEKAIAVGAYTTRKTWTNYQGVNYWYINPEETVDTMSSFSSRGPRVDSGAPQKPNIVAPGSAIISVRDTDIYTLGNPDYDPYIIDNDGLNQDSSGPADYYVMHGTSMACPITAGAAALLLEAQPSLKGHPADVRNLLQSTATSVDNNNNIDGYGLLDIQSAIDANAADLGADWLFMVYLDADNNLESAGIDDLNEMEVAGSTDNVKIVVQMDRAERDWDDDTSNGNWTDTKRFYVTRDTDSAIINSPVISDLGEMNMGDPATLQSFIEWSIANYPAQHYALVLWNHGSGWRERANPSSIKSICVDDQANDELTMTELRSALNAANASTGKVLDIVGFDACLMQMVEVAYQVMGSASRPLVDIAVGSEETEPGDGWDYAATLTALTADPTMTPSELATQIVDDYISSYPSTMGITQSAAKLDLVDELATAIDSFAQAMTSATGDWDAIKTARSQAQEYYYDYYIDLYHFAQLVNQDTSISQAVRDAASSVMTAVTNAVIAEGHTASVGNSHGLSIYYPDTTTSYSSDYETGVLFTTDTQWDDFLSAILSSSSEGVTVTQSGSYFYMDNGIIRIGFYGSDGIEWFGGSPGALTMAEVERMNDLLAEKTTQKEAGGSDSKAIQTENLWVYDEDCAIFSPFEADYAAVHFDYCSGYTTEITSSGPLEGIIKESGTGTVDSQPIVWERYTSLKPDQKFVTCRVVIKNEGSSALSNIEFYEYLDMDLSGCSNDYAMAPLASGDTRVHVETKYASSQFEDNWIYQRDASYDYHFGMLMKTPEDVTDFYVAQYYGESPPYRMNIDGQTITTGDIVTGFSWQTDISAGGQQEFYYGLAAPDDLATLKIISNQFHTGGVHVDLSAPSEAVQGDRISISADVTNYFTEQRAITATLTLPSGLSLVSDSEPLEQEVNVAGGGPEAVSWVAVVDSDATGAKTISVTALEPISNLSDDDSASISIQPLNTVSQNQRETGVLIDDDSDSQILELSSSAASAQGSVTLHPSIELVFVDEVEWLIDYPYGCMEQRGSILLGNINIYHYLTNAGRLTDALDNTLRQDIVSGSLDIIDLQHDDQGWGWYSSYSSTPFFTCYALKALLQTRDWATTYSITIPLSDDGRDFDTYVTRGLEWLITNQQAAGYWDGISPDYIQDPVPLTAYMLYTLAEADTLGYSPTGLSDAIANATSWLQTAQNMDGGWGRSVNDESSDSFVTGLTIVALREAGVASSEAYIQNGRTSLISESNPQPAPAPATRYWESGLQSIYYWFAHVPETTSFATVALLKTGSSNTDAEVADALNWMLVNSDTWLYGSTKDGANAVWMFNQLGTTPGTLDIAVDITVNGTTLSTQSFEGTSPSSTTVDVTSYLNATGTNSFDLTSTGTGKVTYEVSLDYFVPRLAVRTDPTLTLTKSITPVIVPGGQGTVTLNFTPSSDVGYVVINDYIPGGFTLDTSSITDGIAYETSGNRVTFALESVTASDTVTISYSMTAPQATLGQINVRGAECLLMYQPTITGSSAGVTTQVELESDITVSPASFDITLAPDTTQDYTLTIGNDGGADLTYDITDQDTTSSQAQTTIESTPVVEPGIGADGSEVVERLRSQMVVPRSTGEVITSFSAPGPGPLGLAWDGEYLWNADWETNMIYKLSPSTGSVVQSFSSPGGRPYGLTYDGTYLWVADRDTDLIYQLDPATGSVIKSIPTPGVEPMGLTWDGEHLWVAEHYSDKIYKLDASDGSIIQSFDWTGTYIAGLTWDGAYLWSSDSDFNTIYKLNPTDCSVITSFSSPGTWPTGLTWDGQYIWHSDCLGDIIYQIDVGAQQDCSWLDESPTSGTVASGSSDPVTVTIDTTGLAEGSYSAEIIIASNDPDEASTTVPVTLQVGGQLPTVASVSPNSGEQGATLEVTIGGTNFTGATVVSFGDGITVNSFTVVSSTQITANISINAAATAGLRDVSVTTPNGTGTLADGFTVVGGVVVSVDAPDTAAPDSDFTANININEVTGFDACNYDVSFDASVLRLDNVASGLIGSTAIPVDAYNEISSGTWRIVQNVSGITGVSGSGYLAVLHFHVVSSGGDSSAISLSNGMLANNLAEEITASWVGDSIDIGSTLPGDANGDGNINALDVTKVERIIAGMDATTPGADANQDGNVNALDITLVERMIAGLS